VTTATRTTWTVDASHTEAGFAVKHLMISTVRGRFADVQGEVAFDPSDLSTGSASVTINVASIDTKEAQRDAHLRSADFFEVEKFPTLTFTSTKVQNVKGETFQLVGNLTIKDVTREVVLTVESHGLQKDPWGGERAGFSATTAINREDFGLTWNAALETGGVLVGKDVKITLDVELIKKA
jgi:polyisoprenoid-binding protein YceI